MASSEASAHVDTDSRIYPTVAALILRMNATHLVKYSDANGVDLVEIQASLIKVYMGTHFDNLSRTY